LFNFFVLSAKTKHLPKDYIHVGTLKALYLFVYWCYISSNPAFSAAAYWSGILRSRIFSRPLFSSVACTYN